MVGLVLVVLLLVMAVFADFFAPMDPKATDVGFAPPQMPSASTTGTAISSLRPQRLSARRDSAELDPVTFQPLVGPGLRQSAPARLLRQGRATTSCFGLIPANRHFFGSTDGQPVHFLGTDKFGRDMLSRAIDRLAHLADDRADGGLHHHRHRHHGRHGLGLSRRPLRRLGAALRRAGARLPATAALSGADDADPGDRAVQRLPRLRHRRHVGAGLGAAVAARCAARRWRWPASNMCAPPWPSAPPTCASSCSTSSPM